MHGCRRDKVRTLQRVASGGAHPAGEHGQPIATAAAFQVEDEFSGIVVIDQGRTGAVIDRLAAGAGATDTIGAWIAGQWKAAMAALWIAQELQRAPKRGLDNAGAIDDLLGQQRARRPDQV